ncbi:MAG TPA: FAD:protein FMN transferase [Candidatus Udaeobacter sp.]|nr:FAD:protein FMN transferase [Candidatus Udaeobacter sp.]
MRSRSSIEIRRCRPLLGTFVEIAASGTNTADLECGIAAAFASVEKVHRLMSYHDARSDVSRMNRDAFIKGVIVHPWTWQVMKVAKRFAEESQGTFDVTVARLLTKWNYLPNCCYQFSPTATSRDIFLRRNHEVFFRRALIVDLGGIAKGFAVDRAVEALKDNGVTAGIVNAGGDLRTFGPASRLIHLRHPRDPTSVAGAVRLRERAMATSGTYFERRKYRGIHVAPLLDGRTGQSGREIISVSVAAAECMAADALTKIVFALREKAAGLLARYHADVLLLEGYGAPSWIVHSSCDTCDQTRFD